LIFLDLFGGSLEPICRVPQKDNAENRHEIVAGSKLRIGAKVIGRFPKIRLKFFDIFQAVERHLLSRFKRKSEKALHDNGG